MHTRNTSAGLALLLSFLIAIPTAALADDTELFTTSANPNVLLMLDTSGSMNFMAAGPPVGDLDGYVQTWTDNNGVVRYTTDNSRMDILWKVVYTLLNADLSAPGTLATGKPLVDAVYLDDHGNSKHESDELKVGRTYYSITVSAISPAAGDWALFPSVLGTVRIRSDKANEEITYTSRSVGPPYTFFFSGGFTPKNKYQLKKTMISSPSLDNFPKDNWQARNEHFMKNLTPADEAILGARLGLMTFTTDSTGNNNWIDIRNPISSSAPNSPPFDPSYESIWNSVTLFAKPTTATPTVMALNAAQGFFDAAYNSRYVCRQNVAILITDGEDTKGGGRYAPTGNGYGPNYYCGGVFDPDGWSSCSASPPYSGYPTGQVARNNAVIQEAADLSSHNPSVKLFTVGVGISDTMPDKAVLRDVLRRAAEQTRATATPEEYKAVGASGDNPSRGADRAFFVTDATEMSAALRNVFLQINKGRYSFTSPTVASVRMTDRNYIYKASFSPAPRPATFWEGSLQAGTINPDNTITWVWDAGNALKTTDPSSRRIFTSNTEDNAWSRMDFDNSTITVPMLGVDNTAVLNSVVNYVRGYNHDNNAKLGDIFHSKPVVVGPPSRYYIDEGYSTVVGGSLSFVDAKATRKRVVYVGTNDGMLHAFLGGTYNPSAGQYDSGTGEELFGFIPQALLNTLVYLPPGDGTEHGYYVDLSPRVADVWIDSNGDGKKQSSEWRTILIGGLRKGGSGYYALDVTEPPAGADYSNYPKVLWEYTNPTALGQTWSEPFIGKVKVSNSSWPTATRVRDRWVAIFGGGNSDAGTLGANLVVLDIATGRPLKTFTTTYTPSGTAVAIDNMIVASPMAVLDANGYVKFAYVNDLDGSLYKFDVGRTGTDNTYSEWKGYKIFEPPSGGQPVYHRVESASISESSRYLFFGTGNQERPVSDGRTGKFYGILDADTDNTLRTESSLANLSSSITSLSGGIAGGSGWFINLYNVPHTASDTSTHSGEKVLSDPVVFYNNVYFTTFTPDAENLCGGGGIARLYGLQMWNAGAALSPLAGEGSVPKVPYHGYMAATPGAPGGIPSSPSLSINPSGQSSIFVGFSTGAIQEVKIDSPPVMKTIKSWKEVF